MSQLRNDDWANLTTGVGTPDKDNRLGWISYWQRKPQLWLEQTWRGGGLAGRIVELPAKDMTREGGYIVMSEGFQDEAAKLDAEQKALGMWAKFTQAICYARAYGGGALVMAVDDGMPWSEPVNEAQIRAVRALHLASPEELPAEKWYLNYWHSHATLPSRYRWAPHSIPAPNPTFNQVIHESRLLIFRPVHTSLRELVQNRGWADPILGRVEQRIADTMSAIIGASVLVQDFGQAVLELEGFRELLADKQGKEMLQKRLEYMRMSRSALGFLIVGKGEQYARQPTPVSGLADLIDTFYMSISADTGIPMPLLTGQAQTGLGDNTSPMTKQWQAHIRGEQATLVEPAWRRLTRYMILAREGAMQGQAEPSSWEVHFNSLEVLSAGEKADLRLKVAQADQYNIDSGLYTAEEAARSHFSGSAFNPEISLDMASRQPLGSVPPPAEAGALLTSLALPQPGASPDPIPGATPPPHVPALAAPPTPVPPSPPGVEAVPTAPPVSAIEPADALNGAQVQAAQQIVEAVAQKQLPRDSGVAMLQAFFNLPKANAEAVMGDVGRTFFATPAPSQQDSGGMRPVRGDDVEEYASLLASEVGAGTLSKEEVTRKLARLYRLTLAQARALLEKKLKGGAPRVDALPGLAPSAPAVPPGPTNFPRRGMNEPVALSSSEFPLFDVRYAMELRDDWPELWGKAASWDRQFERLLPVAREGAVRTPGEEAAIRLREAWARTYASGKTLASVVAQVKHLVVGRLGEEGMRQLLEQEKERIRRRRKEAQE